MEKNTWEVGKTYTTKQMKSLFGVSDSTWSHNRNKLLDNFKQYYVYECSYEGRATFYHILEKLGDYNKPLRKNDSAKRDEIYTKEIVKVIKEDRVQTAKNVSRIIKDNPPIVQLNHKEGTVYENTRLRMREMFGTQYGCFGTMGGITEKIWCGLDKNTNKYFPMEDWQYEKFHSMVKKKRENDDVIKQEEELFSDYHNDLISIEELDKRISRINLEAFLEAQTEFKIEYGFRPIKVPVYGFFDTDILCFDDVA